MDFLQRLLQFGLILGLAGLPGIGLGLAVRLAPVYRLTQRSQGTRLAVVLGAGALCWGLTLELLLWLAAAMIYSIAQFYFDSALGLVPGMTRAGAADYSLAVINELWLRQSPARWLGRACLSPTTTVCQLADAAATIGSADSLTAFLSVAATVPALVTVWLSWRLSRARIH